MRSRVLVALSVAGLALTTALTASATPRTPWAIEEDACIPEISRCVWDASHRGNGTGDSYILVRTADGTFTPRYVSHAHAHRLTMEFCRLPDVACDPDTPFEGEYYDD